MTFNRGDHMEITKQQSERAEELVRKLRDEIHLAYGSIKTLPAGHSARLAYEEADRWLMKPWAN